ncbi:MAG: M20/M25/M40 family metallo-hydrolase [Lachnospiraceae bacterium]
MALETSKRYNEILALTKELVGIPSVNGTSGERDIGLFLEQWFRALPYFKAHPEYLIIRPLTGDPLGRQSIVAFFRGEKNDNPRTLLLHGHTDTVGLEGYGDLAPFAFDPDALAMQLKNADLPEEVRKDYESGEFLFGRGTCDMKAGDAVFMVLFRQYCEHPENFSGNLILTLNPVEENMHTGIIEALPDLVRLKETYHLDLVCALNNDFTAPLYPGDPTKTIYTGIGGKVLPCFYILGKETHVGQCFEGFDASLLAAKLVSRIHLSMDFADSDEGETAYPPSVLKMKDLKTWYNVQTAKEALVYFNYFVHKNSVEDITARLVSAAGKAFEEALDCINRENRRFCELSGETFKEKDFAPLVLTYQELLQKAQAAPDFDPSEPKRIMEKEKQAGTDLREIPIPVIRYLLARAGLNRPLIVLYYAPPYCPHSTVRADHQDLLDALAQSTEKITLKTGTRYRFMKYYPSLSDSSYLKIDDDEASIQTLLDNFPGFSITYSLPVDLIRRLDVPAVNIGTYGADCHKWTERLHMPYTFGVLPQLEEEIISRLLAGKQTDANVGKEKDYADHV